MMTQSQTFLRQAEALDREIRKLYQQIEPIQEAIRQCELEEEYAREQYRLAYKEELASRQRHMRETLPRLTEPHAGPHADWIIWRQHQNRIIAHPKYRYETQMTEYYVWRLLGKLARFNSQMMGIANEQSWNPRNPNPHLP